MMKTKTVSPLRKFYRWKYSGLIVVPTACALVLLFWFYSTSQAEFFDYYSCDTLKNYVNGIDLPKDLTTHDELSEQQHMRLHNLLDECNDFQRFSEPFSHP